MKLKNGLDMIPRAFIWVFLTALTIITFLAVRDFGYMGIFSFGLYNFATMQIFLDLIITLILLLFVIWQDTRERKVSFWPWLIISLGFGTYGPLLYMLYRKK